MPVQILAKGNTIEEIKNYDCTKTLGYSILTGPEGEETNDESYCGSRKAEFLQKPNQQLAKVSKQHVCDGQPGLECGQIIAITEDTPTTVCDIPDNK